MQLIKSRSRPEANLIKSHRFALHAVAQSKSLMEKMPDAARLFERLGLVPPKPNTETALFTSSKRAPIAFTASELIALQSALHRRFPIYDALSARHRAALLADPVHVSADYVTWCHGQALSAEELPFATRVPTGGTAFHSALVRGLKFSCKAAEESKAKPVTRSSIFSLDHSLVIEASERKLGAPRCFARAQHFVEIVFGGASLALARVNTYESSGVEFRSKLDLVDVRNGSSAACQFIQLTDIGTPVAFGATGTAGVYVAIDCVKQ